jgi:hypothetical protein
MSQITKRVLLTRRPRSCAARRRTDRPGRRPPAAKPNHRSTRDESFSEAHQRFSKGAFGQAAACVGGAEKRRACGRARSALRHLTRRDCLSAANEVSEASFAAGHMTEHRRGVGAPAPTAEVACRGLSGRAFAAQILQAQRGSDQTQHSHARFLRNLNINHEIAIVIDNSTTASEAPYPRFSSVNDVRYA